MRHISLFIPNTGGGGAERNMVNLSRALVERGYRVDLVLADAGGEYSVPAGVHVVTLGKSRVIACTRPLARYLRHSQPDVLLATLDHANLVAVWAGLLARTETRIALRVATTVSEHVRHAQHAQDRLFPILLPLFYRFADAISANSRHAADDIARFARIKRDRVDVVYNIFANDTLDEKRTQAPDHAWFDDDVPVILGVGRLNAVKDYSTLIRAFARIRAERPARLIILGQGEERDSLLALAGSLGVADAVSLPGWSDNPYAYMARSAVFALTSRFEGSPNVLIEALACGCPCVSTDSPGGSAEILGWGEYGRLAPVGDDVAVADAIRAQLDEPTPVEAMHRRAADFTPERVIPQYIAWLGL